MAFFVSLEGTDGSGKSTQASLLARWLRLKGHQVTETREPGGTPLGDRVRELILDPGQPDSTPLTMALLLSASRAQLVSEVIRPALDAGRIVVADRYADSTVAYQSFGLGLDLSTVHELTRLATGGLRPDVIIYVDVEPETGMARIAARGTRNRLDTEALDFHRRVREGYRKLIAADPDRWVTVDGMAGPGSVERAIIEAIEPRLDEVAGVG